MLIFHYLKSVPDDPFRAFSVGFYCLFLFSISLADIFYIYSGLPPFYYFWLPLSPASKALLFIMPVLLSLGLFGAYYFFKEVLSWREGKYFS